ncbi:MAG: hypothetical protein R3B13_19270 [Polyangiaceae bacterium]
MPSCLHFAFGLLLGLLTGCASSTEPSEKADSGSSPFCPPSGQSCPAGCIFVSGSRVGATCIEKVPTPVGCVPEGTFTLDSVCVRGTAPDSGAYILPSGTYGNWLTQPDGGFEWCTGEQILPDGSQKPPCGP